MVASNPPFPLLRSLKPCKPTTLYSSSSRFFHSQPHQSNSKPQFKTPKSRTKDTIRAISNILKYSTWDSAQQHLQTIKWDSYTVTQLLKTHPPMEKAWLFFNWASRLPAFKHDQFTYTTMLDIFGEANRLSSMNFLFNQMHQKGIKLDVVTYTSMLHWLSHHGHLDDSVKVWDEMRGKGIVPTVVSYTAYIKVLFTHGRANEAAKVYKEMLRSGCPPNCFTYTVLMEHLAGSGKFDQVLDMFVKMQEAGVQPDKAACNILVESCCKAGETRVMMKIIEYMKENLIVLRQPIYAKALKTLKDAGESDVLLKESHRHLSTCYKKPEPLVISVDERLVLYLLTRKHFIGVDCLLKDMMGKNVFLTPGIVSSVIDAYTAHERRQGAVLAYEVGKKMGIKYEKTVYISLVGLFIRTNYFPKIVDIVEEMVKNGICLGVNQSALLIYKLGCANKPASAAKVFDLLPDNEKNTTAYTALMAAYFASRNTSKGLQVLTEMKDAGIAVVAGTYNVLLGGLEKSGRLVEFEHYKKEKKQTMRSVNFSEKQESAEEMTCNLLFGRDYVS